MNTVIVDGVLFEVSEETKNKVLNILSQDEVDDSWIKTKVTQEDSVGGILQHQDNLPVSDIVGDIILKESMVEKPKAYSSPQARLEAEKRLQQLNNKLNKGSEKWEKDFQ